MKLVKNNYSKPTSLLKAILLEQRLPWKYQEILLNHPNVFIKYRKIDGLIIRYRKKTADKYIINEIFYSNEYPFEKFNLSNNSVVIDIGAQIGCFTLKTAKIVNRGTIYSFEPIKWNYKLLKKNIKLNNLKNVKSFRLGISNKKNEKIYISFKNTGGHSIYIPKPDYYFKIKTISLENLFLKENISKVDLLKLDCEDSEYNILLSTAKTYFDKINQIVLEYHNLDKDKKNINYLNKFLTKMGYIYKDIKIHTNHISTGIALFSKNKAC